MRRFDEPAYPFDGAPSYQPGLTIRQQAALMAMQGILASGWDDWTQSGGDIMVANAAIKYADAVLRREAETRGSRDERHS